MDRLDILKDTAGQKVWFYPRHHPDTEGRGRPTATPSVEILDENGSTVTAAATTYVTQDTVNTTVSAAAAAGDKSLTLTAVTGIKAGQYLRDARTYLATNYLGQVEWVTVTGVDSTGKVAYLDEPLEHAYTATASDTFKGCGFYHTLQATEYDELGELFRARATYAVGGRNFSLDVPFDVVLVQLPNLLDVTLIKDRRPDIAAQDHAGTRGSKFSGIREEAWNKVRAGIRAWGTGGKLLPARVRTPRDLEEWALAEFDLVAHLSGVRVLPGEWTGEAALNKLEERVAGARLRGLSGGIGWIDKTEDDARQDDEIQPQRMDFTR